MTKTLDFPFQLGDPVEHRGIVIARLFPARDPVARYVTLDEALPQGLAIAETSASGAVPELAVRNPLVENVLLYDGEELVGAKQNRILNVTVLVAAGSSTVIPVSCVEQGRWSARSAQVSSGGTVSHVHLRRRKAEMLAAQPLARGIAQGEVWDEVGAKAERMGTFSPTAAAADTYRDHDASLAELEQLFPLEAGQCGAILALGENLCLDWLSRPDAFVQLWPKLRRGYLLDALETLDGPSTTTDQVTGFLDAVCVSTAAHQPSVSLGDDVRIRGTNVIGSGLDLDGELLQLSAFTSNGSLEGAFGRIARPSARR
jgi:hypothetical protein